MSNGLLISFDGPDSSGKETQARRLAQRLRAAGFTVRSLATPDYTTPSGQELKARLQNRLGNWHTTPWREKMGYFAANRAEHRQEVLDALSRGEVVIYDRYVPSSLAFITVEAQQEIADLARHEIQATVENEEYGKNDMPRESISIFLDVPVQIASRLLEARKRALSDEDEYTDHLELQRKLHVEYVRLSDENPDRFAHIICANDERLLSIEETTDAIWQELIRRFPDFFTAK